MEQRRISVIGCGGIGSYFCKEVDNLNKHNQFGDYDLNITLFDNDTVDTKNLPYQNFDEIDVGDPKSEVLGDLYDFNYEVKKVEKEETLNDSDVVIAAVDNKPFRELLFKWANKNPDKYWIDLRSEGRAIAYFTKNKKNTLKKMLATLADTPEEGTSCQLAHELEKGIIQQGNKIIATIGSQLFMNYLRGEENSPQFIGRF